MNNRGLLEAIETGELSKVQSYQSEFGPLNRLPLKFLAPLLLYRGGRSEDSSSLNWAAQLNQQAILDYFFALIRLQYEDPSKAYRNGISSSGKDPEGRTLLYWAIKCRQPLNAIKKLYEEEDKQPLMLKGMVKNYVEKMATKDNYIHIAAESGHEEAVAYFVSEKIPLDVVNANGRTPLYLAVCNGHLTVVNQLLDLLNQRHAPGGPLSDEVGNNDYQGPEQNLLAKAIRAYFEHPTASSFSIITTVLHKIPRLLLIKPDILGRTPIFDVVEMSLPRLLQDFLDYLKRQKVDLKTIVDRNGENLLHRAICVYLHNPEERGMKVIKSLLKADPLLLNKTDNQDKTPLDFAKEAGMPGLVDCLLQVGSEQLLESLRDASQHSAAAQTPMNIPVEVLHQVMTQASEVKESVQNEARMTIEQQQAVQASVDAISIAVEHGNNPTKDIQHLNEKVQNVPMSTKSKLNLGFFLLYLATACAYLAPIASGLVRIPQVIEMIRAMKKTSSEKNREPADIDQISTTMGERVPAGAGGGARFPKKKK